jgi:hypothetical protein
VVEGFACGADEVGGGGLGHDVFPFPN